MNSQQLFRWCSVATGLFLLLVTTLTKHESISVALIVILIPWLSTGSAVWLLMHGTESLSDAAKRKYLIFAAKGLFAVTELNDSLLKAK